MDIFLSQHKLVPTALSLNTLGASPSIYNTTVPTITVAVDGLNSILKLDTELGMSTPFDGTIANYVNLN